MLFTVIKQAQEKREELTYQGFHSLRVPGQAAPGDVVVIAWLDGETDGLWVTDGTDTALAELNRMYEDEWGPGRVTLQLLKPA